MLTMNRATARLDALIVSPLNARAGDDGTTDTEIDFLADSLAAVGLLHPLVVHELADGTLGVLAGRRRLLAMKRLAADEDGTGKIDVEAIPITYVSGDDDTLAQASIAENLQREGMTDLDLFKAIQRIFEGGEQPSEEQLAQAFGTPVARVRRLVRLAHVHPDIMAAFEAGKLERHSLEQFARTADQDAQKRIWDQVQAREINIYDVARALGFDDDKMVERLKFVGRDAYVAAGGALEQNLFDDDDCRILNPEIVEQLVNAKLEGARAEIVAAHPDRVVEFWPEAPQRDGYRDYQLSAHPAYSDEVQDALDAIDEQKDAALQVMTGLAGEQIYGWKADAILSGEREVQIPKAQAKEWKAAVANYRALVEREIEVEKAPKQLPPAATVCVLEIRRGGEVGASWYFPSYEAAGKTKTNQSGKPVEPAKKPGEEGFDPNDPALTQKAKDYLKGTQANMAARYLASPHAEAAGATGRAHRALIYMMARKLVHPFGGGTEKTGLLHSYAGDSYNYAGCGLEPVACPDLPGLKHKDPVAGFRQFDKEATPAQVDALAAWIFARKIEPTGADMGKTVVTDVLAGLADHDEARTAAAPELAEGFFGFFSKGVLAEIAGSVVPDWKKQVLAQKGSEPRETLDKNVGQATPDLPGWKWLPAALKWPKAKK